MFQIDVSTVNANHIERWLSTGKRAKKADRKGVLLFSHNLHLSTNLDMKDMIVDEELEVKMKKPVISSHSILMQFKGERLYSLFNLHFEEEYTQLISAIHFLMTNAKVYATKMFHTGGFTAKGLKIRNGVLSFDLGFEMFMDMSVSPVLPDDVLKHLNSLVELVTIPEPTEYQMSCSNLTPPSVHSFYSLITENTRKSYNSNVRFLEIEGISKTLLPFQVDSLKWMLEHESVEMKINAEGFSLSDIKFKSDVDSNALSIYLDRIMPGWTRIKFCTQPTIYWYNKYTGSICTYDTVMDYLASLDFGRPPAKGFLCEEMGLGKTLEITTLIKLNPRKSLSYNMKYDILDPSRRIKESKTTLILCPETILSQWNEEIRAVCPELSVYVYPGILYMEEKDHSITPTSVGEMLASYDIVLTSYNILSRELDRAIFKPTTRPKRKNNYERIDYSSPLMLLEFYRLVLDEAQLASISISRVGHFSRIIPRVHTWCVSGTIIRKDLQDLHSLMRSLRLYPLDKISSEHWEHIPRPLFDRLFKSICIRHTKEMIGNQVNLPKQTRIMLRSPFSTIEYDNYCDLFSRFLEQVGLNSNGEPIGEGFDYDRSKAGMRVWSSKLRMICCHALLAGDQLRRNMYVDASNSPVLATTSKLKKNHEFIMGTLEDVLKDLILRNELESSTSFLNCIRSRLKLGKINEFLRQPEESVKIFRGLIDEINEKIKEYKNYRRKDDEDTKITWSLRIRNLLECLHQSYFMLASAYYQHYRPMHPLPDNFSDLVDLNNRENDNEDENEKNNNISNTLTAVEQRFHELEVRYYGKADEILNILLEEPLKRTDESILKLEELFGGYEKYQIKEVPKSFEDVEEDDDKRNVTEEVGAGSIELPLICDSIPSYQETFEEYSTSLGITFVLNRAKECIEQLNGQSTIINCWFQTLYEFQRVPVTDDTEKTGNEYSSYLLLQENSQAYIDQLQLILEDREKAINSTEDMLYTNSTNKFQRTFMESGTKTELYHELETLRKAYIPQGTLNPRYSLHTAVLELVGELQGYQAGTLQYSTIDYLVKLLKDCMKGELNKLRTMKTKVFDVVNAVFNAKVAYFKALQSRSDSLTNYFPDKLGDSPKYVALMEIQEISKKIDNEKVKMKNLNNRLNYLKTLSTKREQDSTEFGEDSCVICRFKILVGSLTQCGHKYCRDCLAEWMKTKKTCPMCNKKLKEDELYNFIYSRGGLKGEVIESLHENREEVHRITSHNQNNGIAAEEQHDLERIKLLKNRRLFEKDMDYVYQELPTFELRDISNIPLKRKYGTKVDMIIRQVKYLINKTPGTQILIFSQWNMFLLLLGKALRYEGVEHRSWMDKTISSGKAKKKGENSKLNQDITDFKKDSSISCFLLNTVAQAAGLTFTNASHVFLCEPIVNLSFELQAINRIHRIGQTRETTVWSFIIEGTIEESIAYLSTKKRIQAAKVRKNALSEENNEIEEIDENILEAKELTKVNDSSKKEGEIIADEDLWAAFFAARSAHVVDSVFV
ncbi:unnamed protein product [Pichia kudriavzevii]